MCNAGIVPLSINGYIKCSDFDLLDDHKNRKRLYVIRLRTDPWFIYNMHHRVPVSHPPIKKEYTELWQYMG